MIKQIIMLLNLDDWMIGDEDIDFAKGSRSLPESYSEFKKQRKRAKISG